MNERLQTIVLVDSDGKASHCVQESWSRLRIANPLRVFSSCAEAREFFTSRPPHDSAPRLPVGALVLDQAATTEEGLALIAHVRDVPALESLPLVVYAADLAPLRACEALKAAAFVRRPMALELIGTLDSLCGLSKESVASAADGPVRASHFCAARIETSSHERGVHRKGVV